MNGYMFDNYKYAVSTTKLQPLSEHSKIDMESGNFIVRFKNTRQKNISTHFSFYRRLKKFGHVIENWTYDL